MYTRVHNVGALSELATNPFRRLALFNCMSLAGDSVHGRLRRCLSVDILLIFFLFHRQQSVVSHNGPNYLSQAVIWFAIRLKCTEPSGMD